MTGPLELHVDGRWELLAPTRRVILGRGDGADIDLGCAEISRRHAVLEPTAQGWTLTDLSRNGTFHDGRRVNQIVISDPTTVSMGAPRNGVRITLVPTAPAAAEQGRLSTVIHSPASLIRIGRQPDNDVVLDDLLVSRHHAELRRTPGGWEVIDLVSGNGTFVNGRRVSRAAVAAHDVIGIGRGLLQLHGDHVVAYVDEGDNAFEAVGVSVTTPDGTTLVHDVGFAVPGRSLLAVIGPSGAGKSTLLAALVGTRPADVGDVRYAGRSLYADYPELRHRIALVPQDDVLHTQLTVAEALTYAARLRFSAMLVLVIGGALMGAAASVRELVKERSIYLRERAIGLSSGAYLASKILVLGAVTGLQATAFTVLSLWGRTPADDPLVLPAGHLEVLVAVLGVTFTTMLIGLAISAAIDNADRGMPLLVLMIMIQLILCGGLFPVHGRPVLEQVAWLVPGRWAFAMAAATVDLGSVTRGTADRLWSHSPAVWLADAAILAAIALAVTVVVALRLARLDPRHH